jgi:hypothetical protein
MFRRNKAKFSKARSDDDMVAPLKGPDVISSSSSAEHSKGGGGRILGMRKKKYALEKGRNGSSTAVEGMKNKSSTNGSTKIDPASNPRTQITIQRNDVPESAPVPPRATQKRSPPSKYNAFSTKETAGAGVRPPPQPGASTQPNTKNPETRDDYSNIRRHLSSRSNPAKPPPLVDASDWDSSNVAKKLPTSPQRVVPVGSASPSTFAPAQGKQPPPLIANGGEHVRGTANAVPMMRSGWSMQSNESSAMNSEKYIQSLDNLPSLRPGTVSGCDFYFSPPLFHSRPLVNL